MLCAGWATCHVLTGQHRVDRLAIFRYSLKMKQLMDKLNFLSEALTYISGCGDASVVANMNGLGLILENISEELDVM